MAESIFPFISASASAATTSTDLPIPKEYAWDFENDCLKVIDGKLTTVTETEAIKIWAMKVLRIPRYRYLAYSWNYGNELESLIGQGLSKEIAQSQTVSLVRDALLVNPYIQDIQDVSMDMENAVLKVNCTLITPYGEVKM